VLATHILAWALALAMLLLPRPSLELSGGRTAEALFVPAYTIKLRKRVWFRRTLDLPALAVGLRELRRVEDASSETTGS